MYAGKYTGQLPQRGHYLAGNSSDAVARKVAEDGANGSRQHSSARLCDAAPDCVRVVITGYNCCATLMKTHYTNDVIKQMHIPMDCMQSKTYSAAKQDLFGGSNRWMQENL